MFTINQTRHYFLIVLLVLLFPTVQAEIPSEWGLGENLERHVSNNRSYDWYRDQGTTGESSQTNCGPATTTMAMTWFDSKHKDLSVEEARQKIRPSGAWWKVTDIEEFLTTYEIPFRVIPISQDEEEWMQELDNGQILLVNLNMNDLPYVSDKQTRVGKFYSTFWPWWGHYIIVKGYAIVDGKFYLEVYDPFSFGSSYSSGQLRGEDRYYPFDQVSSSAANWNNRYLSIGSQ